MNHFKTHATRYSDDHNEDLKFWQARVDAGIENCAEDNLKVQTFMDLLSKADSVQFSCGQLFTSWIAGFVTGVCDDPIVIFSWDVEDSEFAHEIALTQNAIANGTWENGQFTCKSLEGKDVQLKMNSHHD